MALEKSDIAYKEQLRAIEYEQSLKEIEENIKQLEIKGRKNRS